MILVSPSFALTKKVPMIEAMIEAQRAESGEECRVTVMDVTVHKRAEEIETHRLAGEHIIQQTELVYAASPGCQPSLGNLEDMRRQEVKPPVPVGCAQHIPIFSLALAVGTDAIVHPQHLSAVPALV